MAELPGPSLPGMSSSSSSSTPARPKKRLLRPEAWKRNVARAKRARGETYTSPSSGKEVAAAEQGPPCKCSRKCYEKFSKEELTKLFTCFWELAEKNVQDAYLHGLIRVKKVQRRRPRGDPSKVATPRSCFVYVVSFCVVVKLSAV